jgi:hypothetical protein
VLALKQLSESRPNEVVTHIKNLGAAVLLKVTTKDAPTFAASIFYDFLK